MNRLIAVTLKNWKIITLSNPEIISLWDLKQGGLISSFYGSSRWKCTETLRLVLFVKIFEGCSMLWHMPSRNVSHNPHFCSINRPWNRQNGVPLLFCLFTIDYHSCLQIAWLVCAIIAFILKGQQILCFVFSNLFFCAFLWAGIWLWNKAASYSWPICCPNCNCIRKKWLLLFFWFFHGGLCLQGKVVSTWWNSGM